MNEERIVIYEYNDLNETIELNEKIEQIEPKLETLAVTPSNEEQQFESSLDGYSKVTVAGDEDLIAENIKEGVEIFGVQGNAKVNDNNAKISTERIGSNNAGRIFQKIMTHISSPINLSGVSTMERMFDSCVSLESLDLSYFNTSSITDMSYMFSDCKSLEELDLSSFNTEKVTNMSYMFYGCENLKKIDLSSFNTEKVTSTSYMFSGCENLEELDLSGFNVSGIANMRNIFSGCTKLTDLDLSTFDMSNTTSVYNIFDRTNSLTNLKSFKNLGKGYTSTTQNYSNYALDLSDCTLLTHESLMSVIENLYDLASDGKARQRLMLGATNLAKLTEEEIAIATNKGWNVS